MDTKKLFIVCGAIIGGLLLLLLIVWLISLSRPKYITYEALEKKLVAASQNYVRDNEDKFKTDNAKYVIKYSNLVNGGYIAPIDELLSNPEGCGAQVVVTKQNNEYSYVPYLNCADRYTTIELYKQVLQNNTVVNDGSGLHRTADGGYYFKGKNVNNYVSFGILDKGYDVEECYWRILSIGKDNSIKLRATKPLPDNQTTYDNRYNINKEETIGYNRFDDSILQEKLTAIYDNNIVFNAEQKTKLIPRHLCIGARTDDDTTKDGSTECSKLSAKSYYISTITPYEYLRVSLDPNCTSIKEKSCSNDNYLARTGQSIEWLITAVPDNDYQAYSFDGYTFDKTKAEAERNLYIVVELNDSAFYKTGDGSLENPYRIKLSTDYEEDNGTRR